MRLARIWLRLPPATAAASPCLPAPNGSWPAGAAALCTSTRILPALFI